MWTVDDDKLRLIAEVDVIDFLGRLAQQDERLLSMTTSVGSPHVRTLEFTLSTDNSVFVFSVN